MIQLLKDLYPLNRHLVGGDNRRALELIEQRIGGLNFHAYPTGEACWTWHIPEEWVVNASYIESEDGLRFAEFREHPLHVVCYSLPVDTTVSREELFKHIHTSPKHPDAIPYVTKYYERDWGFCLSQHEADSLKGEQFRVVIDSDHVPGELLVGERTLPGKTDKRIIVVTNICHAAQVNDSITGVVVACDLVNELAKFPLNNTYTFLFLPETIGSVAWMSHNEHLIPTIDSGLFFEMLGTDNSLLLQRSFSGDTKIDRIAEDVLSRRSGGAYRTTEFRKGPASDEMIFDGPGIRRPMINISRYPYPEYHTSLDTPEIISQKSLEEARDLILEILLLLDADWIPVPRFTGPVFLSGYGLWVDWQKNRAQDSAYPVNEDDAYLLNISMDYLMNLIDGKRSVFEIYFELKYEFKFPVNYETICDVLNKMHDFDLVDRL